MAFIPPRKDLQSNKNNGTSYYNKVHYDDVEYCNIAFQYVDEQNYREAIYNLNKAIEINPCEKYFLIRAYFYITNAKTINGSSEDFYRAISDCNEIKKINNSNIQAYLYQGESYFQLEMYNEAINEFNVANELKPNDKDIEDKIIQCKEKLNSQIESFNTNQVSENNTDNIDQNICSYEHNIQYYMEREEYEKAIIELDKAIKIDNGHYINRAVCYLGLKRYYQAIEDFSKAIELMPNKPKYYYLRAVCYEKTNNYEKAIKDYSKVIELEPENIENYFQRALCYLAIDELKNAITDYIKSIELNSEEAIEIFSKLIEASDDIVSKIIYYSFRAYCYVKLNNYEKAINDYSKAIELNPDNEEYYSMRAKAFSMLNKHEKAIEDFSKAIELNPDNEEYYSERAIVFSMLNKHEKAIKDSSKAIELMPNKTEYYYLRAYCYVKLNNYEKAINDYSKIIEFNQDYKYYLFRSSAYAQLGEKEKAIEDIKKAIEIKGDSDFSEILGKGTGNIQLNEQNIAEIMSTDRILDIGLNIKNDNNTIEFINIKEDLNKIKELSTTAQPQIRKIDL